MFSIFKKKKSIISDISWLGVDIHSHLLPGIDDGAADLQTSIHLIKSLYDMGISKFFCTPHIFPDVHPNSSETILSALTQVREKLKLELLQIEINAAAEYMINETFQVNDRLMSLPGKHILIEMSYLSEYYNIEQAIFDLQNIGYNVVLAHPERYLFYHQNFGRFNRLKDMGVLFQLNLLSSTGYYGKDVKKISEFLIQKGYYDLAGTDIHHQRHLEALSSAVKCGHLYQKLGNYPFQNKELFG